VRGVRDVRARRRPRSANRRRSAERRRHRGHAARGQVSVAEKETVISLRNIKHRKQISPRCCQSLACRLRKSAAEAVEDAYCSKGRSSGGTIDAADST
jgi:hypothetical protein